MKRARRSRRLVATVLAVLVVLLLWAALHGGRQDWPWTPLDLGAPPGLSTGPRLVGLADHPAACRALLDRAGVHYATLAARRDGPHCGFSDGVRFLPGGSLETSLAPHPPEISCPVAAALAMWEWDVVQPAALRSFGATVAAIVHFGSYNCRRMYGRETGAWSEHAGANAIDIAGFRLADGRQISVARDWRRGGPEASFLHRARSGACPLFATVLSPDYNAAHRDHLHLDEARRGGWGWRACR